ncbi:branched-chain amino acid ABC transporter permease [Asanoa sp. NPDC050611]|uniref:branched-chain amino acid ABC transporter permease n=1 Tax=Asanoa sp. NPDC050611 TaxID=3157098 RepID=UPI00340368E0
MSRFMPRMSPWVAPVVIGVLVLLFATTQDSFYRLQLGTLSGIYAIAAVGLTLLFGAAGQISLGQAGLLGIAAFSTAYLTVDRGMGSVSAGIVAVAASTVVGLLLGWCALRITGHYLALVTLAFGLVFTELTRTVLPDGWYGVPPLAIGSLDLGDSQTFFVVVWALVVLVLVASTLLVRSRFGRSIAALRDDSVAASACGVDLARTKVAVFGIASALAGVSGWLFALYQGSVTETSFSFNLSFNLLIMVVIGGLGSPTGAVVGAVFLVLAPELGRSYEQYRLLSYGLVLILVLALLPGGLASVGRLVAKPLRRLRSETVKEPA